jgi:type IV pilus assembly protein PilY1
MKSTLAGCLVMLLTVSAAAAAPDPLNLARTPLFLSRSVEPNLFVTLDDSFSMRSAFLRGSLDNRQSVWVIPDKNNDGKTDSDDRVGRCGWQIPRFYSSDTNFVYYDPDVTYEPPLRWDGTSFPNASFTAAWVDGISANSGGTISAARVINLASGYYPTYELNLPASAGTSDPRPAENEHLVRHHLVVRHTDTFVGDDTDASSCSNSSATWKFPLATATLSPAFYYRYKATAPRSANGTIPTDEQRKSWNYQIYAVGPAEQQNFANWYSYYRTRYLAAKSALSFAFARKARGVRIAWQNQEQNHFVPGSTAMRDYDAAGKQAFFNWLYSHRMQGETPTRAAMIRAGKMISAASGARNDTNPYWDARSRSELSCRNNYHLLVTDGYWNEPDPDLSEAPSHDRVPGEMPLPFGWDASTYPRDASGFAIGRAEQAIFWNEQTSASGRFPTLSDIAFHFWISDARSDLRNDVPARWTDLATGVTTSLPPPATGAEAADNAEVFWNPVNDPARHQHLVNYAVSFGTPGTMTWSRIAGQGDYERLRKGQVAWPPIENEDDTGIDDLWHATINSRGGYFMTDYPAELADALGRFLEIVDEQRGAAAASTVSSGVATANTLAFRAGYDTVDWSGFVEASRVGADGVLEQPPIWNAAERFLHADFSPAARNVLTSAQPSGQGIGFRWNDLPADYRAVLDIDPATAANDGLGEARVDYLRGDATLEMGQPNGKFRIRRSKLGAIAHASSVFVAAPSGGYDDSKWPEGSPEHAALLDGDGYARFVADNKARRRQLIVGANDGMLHAFDAGFAAGNDPGTGDELWAYVPHEVKTRLPLLTQPGTGFEPFVDSSVSVRDVFLAGRGWRTVLVGALRRGGQGYFALDITDPAAVTEANAAQTVLWEFSDAAGEAADLGFSYASPNIARLGHGNWAAVLSSGYNSQEPDAATGSGNAALFVVDMATGTLVRRLSIPNATGLGPATMIDMNADGIDEAAVAGTLEGDLYYFDLTADRAADWPAPVRVFEGLRDALGEPLQPITSAPRVFGDTASGRLMVLFGTGKLLESEDPGSTAQQAFYAIRLDEGDYPIQPADLAARSFTRDGTGGGYFAVSGTASAAESRGWYVSLGNDVRDLGERVVNTPGAHFSSGSVLVTTLIPTSDDPCSGKLRGNFYVLNASTGLAAMPSAIADSNGDGTIDAQDNAIGIALEHTVPGGTPALLDMPGGGYGIVPDLEGIELPTPTWRRRNQGEVQ